MADFSTEGLGREGDGVALYVLVDGVVGQIGLYGFGNVDELVKSGDGQGLGIVFPVVSLGLQGILEGIKLPVLREWTLQILGQSDVELVKATEGVEFLPECFGEGRTVSLVTIHLCTYVEEDAVNLGVFLMYGIALLYYRFHQNQRRLYKK